MHCLDSRRAVRIDTFKNGGDIYCASASKMFKVPVEKHGVNGELRRKGENIRTCLHSRRSTCADGCGTYTNRKNYT